MADFTTIRPMYNNNTDASPTYVAFAFSGSAGQNEIRWSASGAGGASTASASWPQYSRPASTAAVVEAWVYGAADATGGVKVATYTGTNANANQFCIDYDNLGTYATAPTLTAYSSSAHNAPSAGTQPGAEAGSPIINGHATDTGSASYLKINEYGDDQTTSPAAGTTGTVTVTSGSAGSVSPGAAAWLANFQSAQGTIQYITHRRTPAATTAGKIFFVLALFTGPNMSLGTITPVVVFTYSFV